MSALDWIIFAACWLLIPACYLARAILRKRRTQAEAIDIDPPVPAPGGELTRSQVDEFSRRINGGRAARQKNREANS